MTYAEKLKDPRWQKKRLLILERDNFHCTECKDDKETLQIHHKRYFRNKAPWDYEDRYLTTLCETCHFIQEFYHKYFNKSEFPFLIIKTQWGNAVSKIVLAYCYVEGIAITRILKLNFKRKSIKEESRLPVNLRPLKPIS
jgi:hypothetical protein